MTMSDMTNLNEPAAERSGTSSASAGPVADAVVPDDLVDQVMAKVDAEGLELLGADGVLAQLTQAVLERALDDELTVDLGYERGDPAGHGSGNSRNGTSPKTVLTEIGPIPLAIPRDRNGSFEPQLIPKHSRRLDGFNERIVSLYAGGLTTRDIRRHLAKIYQVDVSPELISRVTDGIVEELNEWQSRPLEAVYPILYIDALVIKVRDHGTVVNKPAYLGIGVDVEGRKQVLGIWLGDADEGAKYWLTVLTEIRNRGVTDVLIVCCDGLKGLPDAIEAIWPKAVVQTYVIHLLRGSFRYSSYNDRKAIAAALQPIYTAVDVTAALAAMDDFELTWGDRYPGIVRLWRTAWERFTPFLAFPAEIRKIVYTMNLIESVNYQLRKVSRNRGHFRHGDAALKLLRLVARDITTTRSGALGTGTWGWRSALNIFEIHFPDRLPIT
jgi:transposase-like protein